VYDEIQCFGSLRDRAGFLFRAQFWQPASFTLRVHQYTVCDLLRFWPARVMHDARRCAQHESQRLAADAWILNDMRKTEEARRLAELALSQVPACVCHRQSPPFSESRDDVKLVPTAVWVPAGPSYFPNPPLDIGAPPPPFTVNFSLSGMDHLGSADGAFQGPVSASPLPVVRPRPFPVAAAARRVLCDACRRPLVLTAAESAVYFTLGFIAHPSSDALDAYIVNLRSCLERGRRAIACNNIGTIFTRRGDHGTATLWHRCALRLNPNFFLPYRNLSKGLLALDDHHGAAAILDEALFHCHPSPPEAIFERLRMSVNRTATDAAEATLRRIIALHPRWSLPYRLLALLVEARGCPLRAAHILTEVINVGLDPADLSMRARLVCRNPSSTSAAAVDMRLAATLAPDVAQFTRWIEESAPSSSFVWTP
jgi:tetratricopeptide (TPR) repeat protein